MLVEPFDGLAMLVTRLFHHPNDHLGTLAGRIGDGFAQMVVVGRRELVFNDDLAPGSGFLRIDVDAERSNGRLGLDELEFDANGGTQQLQVGFFGKPFREVERLVVPDIPKLQTECPKRRYRGMDGN